MYVIKINKQSINHFSGLKKDAYKDNDDNKNYYTVR